MRVAPRRGYWARVGPSRRARGGAARLAHELVDGRGEGEFPAPEEAVQKVRHEGLEPVGADPAAGLPEDLGGGGDLRAIDARPAARARHRPGPGGPAEEPDGRFAVEAGHGHDLVQQLVLLGAGGVLVAPPLLRRILPQAGSGHRHLLGGFGNPDF